MKYDKPKVVISYDDRDNMKIEHFYPEGVTLVDDLYRSRVPDQWPTMQLYFHNIPSSPVEIDITPIREFVDGMPDEQKALYSSTMGVFREIWAAQDGLENND